MAESQFAVPEMAAVEVKGITREAFLVRGTLAAVAAGGFAAVGPFMSTAFAAGVTDVDILNYALTLEYLESDFYNSKSTTVGLTGAAKTLVQLIAGHEAEHVTGLTQAIMGAGGTPAKKPKFKFAVSNQAQFLALASVFEATGVSAYNGQGPHLKNKTYLGTAGTIVQVEARHAAAINYMIGKPPAPDGFDKALEMPAVLKAVTPFITK